MAIIKAVNSKASIAKAINYVTKEEKTEEKLISGKDCNPYAAIDEMKATKEQWEKTEGRQYTHLVQSFNPEDNLTPEQAHKIGKEFIENSEKFKGHEVVIATHTDKGHIHNHFIINSVNFENGKKLHTSKKDLQKLKEHNNEICKAHELSIIKEPTAKDRYSRAEYGLAERGIVSWKDEIRETIKIEKSNSKNYSDFKKNLTEKYGVEVNERGKNITFTHPNGQKVRGKTLGLDYERGTIENGFSRQIERRTGKSTEQQEFGGPVEGNERTQRTNAELHKSSYERKFSNSNDSRQSTESDSRDQQEHSTENGIDIAKARKLAEELRRKSSSSFGKWQDGNEQQQQNDINEDERDRGNAEPKHEQNERGGRSRTERIREQDVGLDL